MGFEGKRVLVVGAGNSAGRSRWTSRGGGALVDHCRAVGQTCRSAPASRYPDSGLRGRAGRAAPEDAADDHRNDLGSLGAGARAVGLPPPAETPCPDVPLIGFHLADALRAGTIRLKRGIAEFVATGVRFTDGSEEDFDEVILATGYSAALGPLGDLVHADDCGFARRRNRVLSAEHPNLYFVGHNYDTRGALRNIAHDARLVARMLAKRAVIAKVDPDSNGATAKVHRRREKGDLPSDLARVQAHGLTQPASR